MPVCHSLAVVVALLADGHQQPQPHWAELTSAERLLAASTASGTNVVVPPAPPATAADACSVTCTSANVVCGPPGRFWLSLEFLFWAVSGSPTPPLLTAHRPDTPREALGRDGVVLFGGTRLNDDVRPGFRVRGGLWLDCQQECGIEIGYFRLEGGGDGAAFASTGIPILTRPIINAQTGAPDAELVAFPGVLAGAAAVSSSLELHGLDVNILKNICCSCCSRVDLLVGYRFLELTEELTIAENLIVTETGGVVPPGTRFRIVDHFRTENRFHGAQFGLAGSFRRGDVFFDLRGTVALGVTEAETSIAGGTAITVPGAPPVSLPGGLLALSSNSGLFTRDRFTVVPALGLRLGYQLTQQLRFFVGYDTLYWSNLSRPGAQIDPVINPSLLPPPEPVTGPLRPRFLNRESDLWVHGGSVGVELRW
jgi:hypothetical protein